jgi:2-polyprenyl-3-methyl-5-hydroxy-6-metoxy-1,4-benzoquinol methylase
VDVGCGTGSLAEQMVRSGLHVTGVEPEAYLRARFDRRVTALDPGSRSVEGPVDRLPFADGELAGVVMTEVLEHVDDPVAALAELRRVMDLDGPLCLSVPTSYTGLLYWRLHPRYADNATHERIFTKPELRRLIERAGFEIVRWEGRNFLPAGSRVVPLAAAQPVRSHPGD